MGRRRGVDFKHFAREVEPGSTLRFWAGSWWWRTHLEERWRCGRCSPRGFGGPTDRAGAVLSGVRPGRSGLLSADGLVAGGHLGHRGVPEAFAALDHCFGAGACGVGRDQLVLPGISETSVPHSAGAFSRIRVADCGWIQPSEDAVGCGERLAGGVHQELGRAQPRHHLGCVAVRIGVVSAV